MDHSWCWRKDLFAYGLGFNYRCCRQEDFFSHRLVSILLCVCVGGCHIYFPKDICLTYWKIYFRDSTSQFSLSVHLDFSDTQGAELLISQEKSSQVTKPRLSSLEKKTWESLPGSTPSFVENSHLLTLRMESRVWPGNYGSCPIPASETPASGHEQFGDPEAMSDVLL